MATIIKSLSKREKAGKYEILLRLRGAASVYDLNGKSGIYVTADNFKGGEIVVNRRKVGNDNKYHEEQQVKLGKLCNAILDAVKGMENSDVNKEWFKGFIDRFNNPDKYLSEAEKAARRTWQDVWAEYESTFIEGTRRGVKVIGGMIARWERFRQLNEPASTFTFDIATATSDDIEDLLDYVANEHALQVEYPTIFKQITTKDIEERGGNRMHGVGKRVRSFFSWCLKMEYIENNPAANVAIGREHYGDVNYLTRDELRQLLEFDGLTPSLARWRDLFILQSSIGARFADLMALTYDNITEGGILSYCPMKTHGRGTTCRVPLNSTALAIIERYKGVDKRGHLFPTISNQKYNTYLKTILETANISRRVCVLDSLTGQEAWRPLYEIASSHMARRTFINAIYQRVQDPTLIGRMSGHAENSRAFARYRKAEDDILRTLTDKINIL